MGNVRFEGAWTALVTPFSDDGNVDWDGFTKNVQFQLDQGISGLVPTGTTGESPTLGWEEHNSLIQQAVKLSRGKAPVLAGTGSNSTREALEATRRARDAGAEGALLVDCYYNGPSSLELREKYHGLIARECPDIVIVPYVIPGRTGTAIAPEDIAILAAECPNIRAVKEATGDLDRMALTRKLAGNGLAIMSGDDDMTYQMMTHPGIRAAGAVSVISNVVPAAVEELTREALTESPRARELAEALGPLAGIVTVRAKSERTLPDWRKVQVEDRFRNPLAIKTLMAGLGMPAGPSRAPLGKMSPPGIAMVREAVRKVWEANREILRPVEEFYEVDVKERLKDDGCWQ